VPAAKVCALPSARSSSYYHPSDVTAICKISVHIACSWMSLSHLQRNASGDHPSAEGDTSSNSLSG